MRINVEIDDALLAEAMRATGQTTKRATVEEALRTLVRLRDDYRAIRELERAPQRPTGPSAPAAVGITMRTNIEVDDRLLAEAQAVTGDRNMRATIEDALRLVVQLHRQYRAGLDLAGIGWDGDLDAMREDWTRDP